MRSIIYNYQAGAGGEGYVAKQHDLPHSVDKVGKVRLHNSKHNLPKELVLTDNFFGRLMELGQGIYLTHHLYLLNVAELEKIYDKFDIISIDSSQHLNEIFLMRLFKDLAYIRDDKETFLILQGKIRSFINLKKSSLLHHLTPGGSIPDKIKNLIAEYSRRQGIFYDDNINWHKQLTRIPGEKLLYKSKGKLGQIYLHGCYWDLDAILCEMHNG